MTASENTTTGTSPSNFLPKRRAISPHARCSTAYPPTMRNGTRAAKGTYIRRSAAVSVINGITRVGDKTAKNQTARIRRGAPPEQDERAEHQ